MRDRLFDAHDLADLMRLSGAAGWNQTEEDWLRLIRLQPDGCFAIEDGGRLVATATAVRYGDRLSWIGMVLTLPECRGRGLARELMERSIGFCSGTVVKLDASDMGKPLYERLGFESECFVERWRREPSPADPPPSVEALTYDLQRDAQIFGADRSLLLRDLGSYEGASSGSAYAFGRPGAQTAYFGPCISETPEDAECLLRWFVHNHAAEPTFVDLFPHFEAAATLATNLGFQPVRRLTRMVLRPTAPALPDSRVYAIAGFEYG